jgi:hypothetical protein
MRKYLLNQENVEIDFYSYFDSGKEFKVKSKTIDVTFIDHHWTLENYLNETVRAGFLIDQIDECKVVDTAKENGVFEKKIVLPSYILIKATKRKL